MRIVWYGVVGIAALFLATAVSGQQLATLNVNVTDPSGGGIPEAKVTVQNTETGAQRSEVSNATGLAVIPGLAAGDYDLTVAAGQFAEYKASLTLAVGQVASLPITLRVSTVNQQVKIHATALGIDTEKSEVSQVIGKQDIADLPIIGRDFIDFVLLTPTANVGRSTAVGAQSPFQETVLQLSFGGLRETHSVFFGLDGIDYTTSISGVQRESPSQDWVMEFRVADSPYTADNGRNLGAVVNTVTKSGGNDVHGSVYEFFRNNAMDANNLLSAPGFNTLRFNQFGGNAGGPIRHDKLFYFLGYEGQRMAQSPLYSSFILGCTANPGCMGPGSPSINQVKELLGLAPENLGSVTITGNYDKFFGKLTEVFSDRSVLNVAYIYSDDRKGDIPSTAPGQGLPSTFRNNPEQDQTVYANLLHVLGNQWTSETSLNFARRVFQMNPVGDGFEPSIVVSDLLNSGGFTGSVHYYKEQHFEAAENLTHIHGNHTFKIGADFEPVWIGAETTFFTPGAGVFSPQSFFGTGPFAEFGPGTSLDFLFLQPNSEFGQQIPQRTLPFETGLYSGPAASAFTNATNLNFRHTLAGVYAQDQWKMRPNLTVTFGLRYDIDFMPSAAQVRVNGLMSPTNYNNVQPRVGAAYSFRQNKGVLRVGFGIFTGPFDYSDIMVSWQGASAFTNMTQPMLPQFANPASQLVGLGVSGIIGVDGNYVGPGVVSEEFSDFTHDGTYPSPGTLVQFPLGYSQRKFPNAYAEQASSQVEYEVAANLFVSVGYEWQHARRLPVYYSVNGVPDGAPVDGVQYFTPADTGFGFALLDTPSGYSIYNAGTLSVRKPFARHFSVLGNYTYSKSIDISTDVQLTDTPVDYLDPGLDRAVSDNDIRHRGVMTLLTDTPGQWNPWLRNFKFSLLSTLASPLYYSIYAGMNVNGDQFPFSDRVGNIGRNTYRGDPSYTNDIRLQREFSLRELLKLDLSAEIFNLFNRPNVQAIDTVYGSPTFLGPVPQRFGDGIGSPANPTFGTPGYVAPARQVQLALRLNF